MPVLLYSPHMEAMAKAVVARDKNIELGTIVWKRFADGFPDILIPDIEGLRRRDVAFLACLDSPDAILEQISVMQKLAGNRCHSLRFLLPYFPTGTMERADHEGQVATALTLAQMISSVAPGGPGPIPLYIWDLHALQNLNYFGPNISARGKWGIRVLQKRLEGRDVTIVFPDEGAYKRFKLAFTKDGVPTHPFVICSKTRLGGDQKKVRIVEGDPRGRDVVIIDDLVHSGNTTLECLKVLTEAGATSVSAYATHGVMEKEAWRKFLTAGFAKVWITDTCPDTAKAVEGQGPFEVLSIVDSVHEAVMDGLRHRSRISLIDLAEMLREHLAGQTIKSQLADLLDRLKKAT